jgi:predicted phage-related endonuclease
VSRTVELPSETADLIQRLRHVRNELASYKQLEDELKAEVCELLGDADTAILNGVTVATWKGQKRESFDSKALRLAHPDLAKQFVKEVQTRTFLLKGEKLWKRNQSDLMKSSLNTGYLTPKLLASYLRAVSSCPLSGMPM